MFRIKEWIVLLSDEVGALVLLSSKDWMELDVIPKLEPWAGKKEGRNREVNKIQCKRGGMK